MLKAFGPPKPDPKLVKSQLVEEGSSNEDTDNEGMVLPDMDDILLYCETDYDDEDNIEDIDVDHPTAMSDVERFLDGNMRPLQCSSHLLQLANNHGLEEETEGAFLAYVNFVINFFNNNVILLAKLRKSAGKGLLKKADTRWNYWVHALRRLGEPSVFGQVQKLLEHAHKNFKKAQKLTLPRRIVKLDLRKIQKLVATLQPFGQVTDQRQADGVT